MNQTASEKIAVLSVIEELVEAIAKDIDQELGLTVAIKKTGSPYAASQLAVMERKLKDAASSILHKIVTTLGQTASGAREH